MRHARRVDDLSTSLTINIAEGNGRFSKLDHSKFVRTAEDAGTKLAAYLDLVEAASLMEVDAAKSYLREVMAMLGGLRGYLHTET
ncbi:MAG: four helix bundle protein [Planctomycetes bacterium]|nr:four helix bundle protein [Planctomycetota bacterium]MBL7037471.1 four helix bundle protein [Pirellulaceae bacterium]